MGLNAQQKKAVEYLDGPLLVLAGPGTGKTQLLSEKVTYILRTTDTDASNILCLTFTDTGAKNMRERLKTMIGKDALKVNIGTYHAFGQEILAQYKNYSEDYERKLEQPIDEVRQFKIVKSIQNRLPARDILRGDAVKDILSVISDAKGANLTAEELAFIAEKNIEDSEVLSNIISPLLLKVVPRKFKESYESAYEPIYALLKGHENDAPIIKNIERIIVDLARSLKQAMIDAESAESIKPLSNWRNAYFEKDKNGDYRLKDYVSNKKLQSIAKVMKMYDESLMENGWFDFDDMIHEAVKALKNDAGFKATLMEKYQFIMLDEFQDTNPSQFSIVAELTDYEKPMIMAVGDDDQAIYEFQGASSSNLTDFQKHYNAEVIALNENYRSTQEILDFSREIINQAPDRFADKILTAHKDDPKQSEIRRLEFASSDAEYGFIADEISKLVDAGVKQSEIAVISYRSKYFEPLLPFLKSHPNIKIAYEKRDNLFLNEQIHEIITIFRFVDELAGEKRMSVQLMEILSFPFWGLNMVEVVKLIGEARFFKKPTLDYLAENGGEKLQAVMNFLMNLTARSFIEPFEVMLNYLIGTLKLNDYRSPFLDYSTHKNDYETFVFYENLAALKGKLTQYFGDKVLKVSDLIEMVDDYQEADMPLNITSPYRDAEDAVQILTAHKAKGLEFEYVFIISADHSAWGKGKGNNNFLSLPKNVIQIRHTGITDGERLRVLYVALTRAKKSLTITNALADFKGKSPERLEYFEEYVEKTDDGREKIVAPFLPDGEVVQMYGSFDFAKGLDNVRNWLMSYVVNSPDMRTIYKDRAEKLRWSASALTNFIDIVYAGPQSFFKTYILQAPHEPESEALAYGDLVHKSFEYVTKEGKSDEEAIQFFLEELEKKELPSSELQIIREKGPEELAISLKRFGDILRQGEAEVNFSSDKIVVDGVPVTGKIDHIIVDDKNKSLTIYDFKTGNYHSEKWTSHATLYKYMLQLIFYKMLVKNSVRFRNYQVKEAHILFVTPDKDGEVYDKIYSYNEADEQEFMSLLKAVHLAVSTLGFMDDEALFIEANSERKLKDINDFVALMLEKFSDK